ncbi:MAG: ABC transporter permease subunit, partial [Specibacter sp.]
MGTTSSDVVQPALKPAAAGTAGDEARDPGTPARGTAADTRNAETHNAHGGTPATAARPRADYSGYRLVAAKHPWRWVGTVVVALGVAAIAWSLATNPRWEWGVVAQWFTAESVLRGLGETLKLTVIAGTLGFVLGFVLALMRLSASPLLVSVSWTFSWIFRSTPLLVQMLLWYNLGYLYEKISLGIPFTSINFFEVQTTTLISQFAA